MKKFIEIVIAVVVLVIACDYLFFHWGVNIDVTPWKESAVVSKSEGDSIYLNTENGFERFEIKGVDLGSGYPGEWSTSFEIDEETYLRWFEYIAEMGANTIRVYTIQGQPFYDALYKFNSERDVPLYVIHGVWVDDYVQNSRLDAYAPAFMEELASDSRSVVDVIHGQKKLSAGEIKSAGYGTYSHDISQWVIGYILGVEWESTTVAYTDEKYAGDEKYNGYSGKYMYTTDDASPFETMLAYIGDQTISYEVEKYHAQRTLAFSNWPTTDPFDYNDLIKNYFSKCSKVDVEHIKTTDEFVAGQFASYHVYPYYPDYLNYVDDWELYGITWTSECLTEDGNPNTYLIYLRMLTDHHTMPVVISEFGVSTGRGIAQLDRNTFRNQGHMSESEQGKALAECYQDIKKAGCAGGCIFTWQDEWFKRTWNTMYAINMKRTPYWSDYQTNEQYFGLISFDPGKEECVSYVDGDVSEWNDDDLVLTNGELSLYSKYDERFIYFRVNTGKLDPENSIIYMPIDTTQKSGSTYCDNNGLLFERAADFLITIDGKDNSDVKVQERYEALRSNYSSEVYGFNTYYDGNVPDKDSPLFVDINLALKTYYNDTSSSGIDSEVFNTGKLRHGNANPDSSDYDSLADFFINGNEIEIKIPWQLLNFSDPSHMSIHDDYYDGNYGVQNIKITDMYVGTGLSGQKDRIEMGRIELKGWDKNLTFHERLKASYDEIKNLWNGNEVSPPELKKESILSVTRLWNDDIAVVYDKDDNADFYRVYYSYEADGDYVIAGESAETAYYYPDHSGKILYFKVCSVRGETEGELSDAAAEGQNERKIIGLPVIEYHDFLVAEDIENGVAFDEYAIWKDEFEADLIYIRENGYTTITCEQLIDYLNGEGTLPEKPILLTADDGKYGVYCNAWHLLEKYGMTMCLSIIDENIDASTRSPDVRVSTDAPFCTWDEIKEMSDSGSIEIGSHTYHLHQYDQNGRIGASTMDGEGFNHFFSFAHNDYNLVKNKHTKEIGNFVNVLAYPYSKHTDISDKVWRTCGYKLLLGGNNATERRYGMNCLTDDSGLNYYTAYLSRFARMHDEPLSDYLESDIWK